MHRLGKKQCIDRNNAQTARYLLGVRRADTFAGLTDGQGTGLRAREEPQRLSPVSHELRCRGDSIFLVVSGGVRGAGLCGLSTPFAKPINCDATLRRWLGCSCVSGAGGRTVSGVRVTSPEVPSALGASAVWRGQGPQGLSGAAGRPPAEGLRLEVPLGAGRAACTGREVRLGGLGAQEQGQGAAGSPPRGQPDARGRGRPCPGGACARGGCPPAQVHCCEGRACGLQAGPGWA